MPIASLEQPKETRGKKRPTISTEKVLSVVEKIKLQQASLERYPKGSPMIEKLEKSITAEKTELEILYKQLTVEQRSLLKKILREREARVSKTGKETTLEAPQSQPEETAETNEKEKEGAKEGEEKETEEIMDSKMVIVLKDWEPGKGDVDKPKTFLYKFDDTYIQMLETAPKEERERFYKEGKHRLAKKRHDEIVIEKDPKRFVVHTIEDNLAKQSPRLSDAWHTAMYGGEEERRVRARVMKRAEQLKTADAIRRKKSDTDAPHRMKEKNPYQWRIDTATISLEKLQEEIKEEKAKEDTDLAKLWKMEERENDLRANINMWGRYDAPRFEREQQEKRNPALPALGILENLDKETMVNLCERLGQEHQKNKIDNKEYNAIMSFLDHLMDTKKSDKKQIVKTEEVREGKAKLAA